MANDSINPVIRNYPARDEENPEPIEMSGRPSSTLDMTARVLIWAALGWTVASMTVVIFFASYGSDSQTLFEEHGFIVPILALIPISIVTLPLTAFVSRRVRRITPIVAAITTGLVLISIATTGGFFLPAAFALGAAALLEVADSGNSES